MGVKFEYDNEDTKWWEVVLGWKWPHQGFTIGYDLLEPNPEPELNETLYCSFLLYLGPISIIFNWGNHKWNE